MSEEMIRNGFAVFGLLALIFVIARYLLRQGRRSKASRERLMRRLERL